MTDLPLPQVPQRSPLRFILDHNPFYLMSAVSMLLGCFALLHALQPHPGQIAKLILLLGMLHVYEFLLLGLAVFLINRRGMRRDSRILLIIQSVFLADATFLTAEIFTANLTAGAFAAAAVWLLAVAKVMIAARLAAPAERRGWAISTLSMLALLYLLPGYLAHAEQHSQSLDRAIYISWWLAAGVVAVGAFAIRRIPRDLSLAYLLAPLTSIIAHLLMANWVYHVDFHAANLGPILIATAVVLARHWPANVLADLQKAAIATFPLLASCCSLSAPSSLQSLTTYADISALRLTLLVGSLVFVLFWLMHSRGFLPLAILQFVAALLGSSPEKIADHGNHLSTTSVNRLLSILPTTDVGWGWTAVAGAFVLLGAGAAISLYRPPQRIDAGSE